MLGARYGIPNWTTKSEPWGAALEEDVKKLQNSLAQKMRDIATRQSREKDLEQYNTIIRIIAEKAEKNQALDIDVAFVIRPGTILMLEAEGFGVHENNHVSGNAPSFNIAW